MPSLLRNKVTLGTATNTIQVSETRLNSSDSHDRRYRCSLCSHSLSGFMKGCKLNFERRGTAERTSSHSLLNGY